MRYYAIKITDQDGKLVTSTSSVPGTGFTYTSFANNQSIPGALQIELDIPLKAYATPMKGAMVRIWGVSLGEISKAFQLNPVFSASGPPKYKNIEIYAGMKPGLPLATAAAKANQAGLVAKGSIFQAFGNWVGTDQSLDIILAPDFGTNATPKNISFDWKTGTPLNEAIETTFRTAFPNFNLNIHISDKLVTTNDQPGVYKTLEQFASYIKNKSQSIIGGDYPGVDIFMANGIIQVFDGTVSKNVKQIQFQDLIGQPTWIEGPTIQFKCVMRGDISIADYIQMPQAIVTTTSAAPSSLINLKSAFEGSFFVNEIRHVGNFRQPDAASWVSTFNAVPTRIQPANEDFVIGNPNQLFGTFG